MLNNIHVDDEELELVSDTLIGDLIKTGELNGQKVLLSKSLLSQWRLLKNESSFIFGIRRPPLTHSPIHYYVLLKSDSGYQRVFIERIKCELCDTYLLGANPTVKDLYYSSPKMEEAYEKGLHLPRLLCPNCRGKLPRHFIWARDYGNSDPITKY